MPEGYDAQLALERARVRDLLRYYKPTARRSLTSGHDGGLLENCDDHGLETPPAPTVSVAPEAADDEPDPNALLAHDATLTAFSQLGCFKLNTERSFISLMDHDTQYILAEATRSVSLEDQKDTDRGDEVFLGPRQLPFAWGVCPNTIQVFTAKDGSMNVNTDLVVANPDCYVMNDMSKLERYKTRPYISGWPYMKFYAEVPIHSPTGHVIGTYCVVDDKPRDGLDKKGLKALNEIASAIMKHLELIQMQDHLQRAGEMVEGLGKFVEGKSGRGQQWPLDQPNNLIGLLNRPAVQRTGTVQTLSEQSECVSSFRDPSPHPSFANSLSPVPTTVSPVTSNSHNSKPSNAGGTAAHSRERKLSTDGMGNQETLASTATKRLFNRASSLIREALDLDGILFADAFFRDIAVDTANSDIRPTCPEALRFNGTPDTLTSEKSQWLSGESATRVTTPAMDYEVGAKRPDLAKSTASSELLGHSVKRVSTLGGLSLSSSHLSLPQSTLRGLLRKYRQGHTFVFDEDGAIVPDAEEETLLEPRDNHTDADIGRELETLCVEQLLLVCPGARSIIFFPLWDPQRDQWFAGSLAWTSDPTRIIQSADVTYLAAFGSCIMSEKSRLDALTADRAKADFISSVSHELRSPLHGVLASAEALQETSSGTTQDDMIRTIMICGEALLDTMDQILDYAKTSNSANKIPSKLKQKLENQTPKVVNLDLSSLVESVVEGIFVGHSYRSRTLGSFEVVPSSQNQNATTVTGSLDDVMIILSIDWQASWLIDSQKGGWKRIIMNLFGNALKYTKSGFVHISLKASVGPLTAEMPVQRIIVLEIDDSGKGMSKDYLKYKLFTPFAQEDSLSVGTGLGLSIVRQLVTDLGGKIDIQSEVSYGTTVKVSVPIDSLPVLPESISLRENDLISDIRERCKGLTLCLIGFEFYPDIGENPTGILSAHARRMLAVKSSFTKIAVDWFGMEVFTARSLTSASADILVGLQSQVDVAEGHVQEQPLILFKDAIGSACSRDAKGVVYVSQPAGPHKMARVLALCLDWRASVTERSKLNNNTAKTEIASLSAIHDDTAALKIGDRHSTVLLENGPAEIDAAQLPPPSFPKLPNQEVEGSSAPELNLTMPHNALVASSIPLRSMVLLVEDNTINMKILMNYMKKANQNYVTASNGLEALQKFQAAPLSFKVIFMDLSMPVMDGLTSSRRIRTYELENTLPRTRIVALTCFSSPEYQRNAALSGVDLFLIKPVPMKTLKPILDLDPESLPEG